MSDSVPFRDPSPRALNVVLVEDDSIDVMNVKRAFDKGKIGNPLWVAGDGIEALELLRGNTIPKERRIILLDINLPRMNGLEFLQEIRRDPVLRPTPVIILTTSNDDQDKFQAYDLNVAGYLLKPVTFVSFVEIMAALNRYWTVVELP